MGAPQIHPPVNESWLARRREEALDPGLPIIDPHHHLWDRPGSRYLMDDVLADTALGHNIRATVFVECHSSYRPSGAEAFRPVGETEFVEQIAASCDQRQPAGPRIAAGIVAYADLRLAQTPKVLEAHWQAAPTRLKGIRQRAAWDASPDISIAPPAPPPHLLTDPAFQAGFAHLAGLELVFDAWCFHPQLGELLDLAVRFPSTLIVINHVGGMIGIGHYRSCGSEVFKEWRSRIALLAALPNVRVKLGGLGMKLAGFDLSGRVAPASSDELAELWRPRIETCVELFGSKRCMFESNFPVDKGSCSYVTLWNAFKIIAKQCSAQEREDLLCVPRTSSALICRKNRLTSAHYDRAAMIAGADSSLERSNNEPCIDRAADGITYDPAGPSIEDRSQVHKADRDCDIGDVGHPQLVGAIQARILREIGEDRIIVIAICCRDKPPPLLWNSAHARA